MAAGPAAAELAGLDAATGGLNPVTDLRKTLAAGEVAQEKRRKSRDRALALLVVAVCVISAVVSVLASTNRAEEVAPEVAARVGAQQVGEARQSRIDTGRQKLAEANSQLIARGLPTVAAPGPEVPFPRLGDELFYAATFARLLAILPDDVAAGVRADVRSGRTPAILPSAADPGALPLRDGVVDVITLPSSAAGPPPGSGAPGSAPPRAPRGPAVGGGPRRPGSPQAPPPSPRGGPLPEPCIAGLVLCVR